MRLLQLHEVNAQREWAGWSFLILTYISDTTYLVAIKFDKQISISHVFKKNSIRVWFGLLKAQIKCVSSQHMNFNCNVILVLMPKKSQRMLI